VALPEPRRASAPHVRFSLADVMAARAALDRALPIGEATRASHAAGLYRREDGLVMAREDVGRHNALDKLAGAIARAGQQDVGEALVVLTSRISVEMVQKAAAIGAGALVAISAPTSLAIETAERAGLLLVGVARADGCEIFANAHRIEGTAASAA
jgi:FdhD protein